MQNTGEDEMAARQGGVDGVRSHVQKDRFKNNRESLQGGRETCYDTCFGESGPVNKTSGHSRLENAEVFLFPGGDQDGQGYAEPGQFGDKARETIFGWFGNVLGSVYVGNRM